MIYKLALFVHITNAIVTIGPLFTIFVTLHKMKSLEDKQQIQGTIEGIRSMIRTVEIGGHFIVPTGIIVLLLGGWAWSTSWIVMTLIILAICLIILAKAFKPATRLIGTTAFSKDKFISIMYKSTFVYLLIMLTFLWLMVAKPSFW